MIPSLLEKLTLPPFTIGRTCGMNSLLICRSSAGVVGAGNSLPSIRSMYPSVSRASLTPEAVTAPLIVPARASTATLTVSNSPPQPIASQRLITLPQDPQGPAPWKLGRGGPPARTGWPWGIASSKVHVALRRDFPGFDRDVWLVREPSQPMRGGRGKPRDVVVADGDVLEEVDPV